VLKVGKLLEANRKWMLYKKRDRCFVDLVERANIANRMPHIFVSIHCNANRNTTADGTETYVMGMNKIASNLEAAKKRTLLLLRERL
jgi:N-acetylmuramoyl-L-alanine amidase